MTNEIRNTSKITEMADHWADEDGHWADDLYKSREAPFYYEYLECEEAVEDLDTEEENARLEREEWPEDKFVEPLPHGIPYGGSVIDDCESAMAIVDSMKANADVVVKLSVMDQFNSFFKTGSK